MDGQRRRSQRENTKHSSDSAQRDRPLIISALLFELSQFHILFFFLVASTLHISRISENFCQTSVEKFVTKFIRSSSIHHIASIFAEEMPLVSIDIFCVYLFETTRLTCVAPAVIDLAVQHEHVDPRQESRHAPNLAQAV